MTGSKKACSLLLTLAILLTAAFGGVSFNSTVSAQTLWFIKGTNVYVREDATTASKPLGQLSNVSVTVNGEKDSLDENPGVWYNITCGSLTGYVYGEFVEKTVIPEDQSFEALLAEFPESYKPYLLKLHASYPNWKFIADRVGITLDNAVQLESTRKLVSQSSSHSWLSLGPAAYDYNTGTWVSHDTKWYVASREVIKYYMDPRNFLDESYIYTFLLQGYHPAAQTAAGVRKIVNGTFLNTDEYVNIIMEAAQQSGMSPYIIASKIIQEQGRVATSPLISGNYPGYEGYYNYFNVQASGSSAEEQITKGLSYAKREGWDSPRAAIIGGAKFCADGYISKGQNTYYYMDFNIKNPSLIYHEYANAIHDASAKGLSLKKTYAEDKQSELSFLIPVYEDMGNTAAFLPAKTDKLNNYYFDNISIEGLTPSFDRFTYSYDLELSADSIVKVELPEGAEYVGAKSFKFSQGQFDAVLTVRSQSGYDTNYVISVLARKACTLYVDYGSGVVTDPDAPDPTPTPEPTVLKGDTNDDGKINGRDIANVQMHVLGIRLLSGNGFTGADTNGDGKINGRDIANIQMHVLGIRLLS